MKQACVIDSSIGHSWVHGPQTTTVAADLLKSLEDGAELIVPPLWFIEMANGLLVLERRKKIARSERLKALELLDGLHLSVDDAPPRYAFTRTSELADKHGLTVYDATYLELALRRKTSLATRDDPLRDAAKRSGVTVL